ncbi:hypothetical protein F5Y16DRAFT_393544 [Xylariaceae sp. FL0255]|nr:hypothetical protein F5Y16DRAFT_393544 [Xylariaceae sp. FL0255]
MSLITALVNFGALDLNNTNKFGSFWRSQSRGAIPQELESRETLAPIDIAAFNLNIQALRTLLRLGAAGGDARSVVKDQNTTTLCRSEVPPPLWHVFNKNIRRGTSDDGFAKEIPWDNQAFIAHTSLSYFKYNLDWLDDDCMSGKQTGYVPMWDAVLKRICRRIGTITSILIDCEPHYRDLYEKHGEISEFHPMHRLLELTKGILSLLDAGYPVEDRLAGLGRAYDLLIHADPELRTVNALRPPSTKKGIHRLLEVVGWNSTPLEVDN